MDNLLDGISFGEVDENDGSPVIIEGNPNVVKTCRRGSIVAWAGNDLVLYVPPFPGAIRTCFEVAVEAVLEYHDCCSKMEVPFCIHYPPGLPREASERIFDDLIGKAFEKASGGIVSGSFMEIYKIMGGVINAVGYMTQGSSKLSHENLVDYGSMMYQTKLMVEAGQVQWPRSVGASAEDVMTEIEDVILRVFNHNALTSVTDNDKRIRVNWRPSIQGMATKFKNESLRLGIASDPKLLCQCKECRLERGIIAMERIEKKIDAMTEYLLEEDSDDIALGIEDV